MIRESGSEFRTHLNPSGLTKAALHIHADQIERYGGDPLIRDLRLLESAVAMPRATFDGTFLHTDLFEMAAAYLFHIVQNHAFLDANKRTGAVAALVFLEFNDIELDVDEDELADVVLSVAQGRLDKPAIAAFFRSRVAENRQP